MVYGCAPTLYLAAGTTQPDKLVLRIMGHEHLVEAIGTSVEVKHKQKKKINENCI